MGMCPPRPEYIVVLHTSAVHVPRPLAGPLALNIGHDQQRGADNVKA